MRIGVVVAVLLLSGCGGSKDGAVLGSEALPTASTGEAGTTGTDAPAETADPLVDDVEQPLADEAATDPPSELAFSAPTVAADAAVVELDDDVTIETTVYQLVSQPGGQWQLPFSVAVPAGWTYDVDLPGFTDGQSTMAFTSGCPGPCQATAWDVVLSASGGYLREGLAGADEWWTGEGAVNGFASGADSATGYQSNSLASPDDGSGRSVTALFHYDGARFIGCEAEAPAGATFTVDVLQSLCQAIEADWSGVVAATTTAPITEQVTERVAVLIADPTTGNVRQVVPLETGDLSVSIELPLEATFSAGPFGTEIALPGDFSIFTDLSLNAECDGVCAPQDWESKINATTGQLGRSRFAVTPENDVSLGSGWLLSGPTIDGDGHLVLVARWDDDADYYFSCTADVDGDDVEHIDDLIAMCLSAQPEWLAAG